MREKLRERRPSRSRFTGTFERFGTKTGYKGRVEKTVLLVNVKDALGDVVTDHLWFNLTLGFEALDLQPGQEVAFDARVKSYIKGYRGYRDDVYDKPVEQDFKLDRPTNVRRVQQPASISKPGDHAPGQQLSMFVSKED